MLNAGIVAVGPGSLARLLLGISSQAKLIGG